MKLIKVEWKEIGKGIYGLLATCLHAQFCLVRIDKISKNRWHINSNLWTDKTFRTLKETKEFTEKKLGIKNLDNHLINNH